ncbi:MAG: hypothetical protein M1818_004767 [Claussenomyces sp. TS43310]|nr:MAG: hypothetical protein M1818_004767 [Claussenomyces sp. TS43310]
MKQALEDWNVQVLEAATVTTVTGTPPAIWSIINPLTLSPELAQFTDQWFHGEDTHITLPFEMSYQLEVCISQNLINEHNITKEFISRLGDLALKDPVKGRTVLEYIAEQEVRIYDPLSIFGDEEAFAYSPNSKVPHYCGYTRKATITPTMIYFSTPTVEMTNRVIRHYASFADRFLRVQFTGEKTEGRINSCADKTRDDEIYLRVYRTLANGIQIGHRHYEFLAFGNSQFRENGAYFFCPHEHLTCDDIRQWMGNFTDIRVVAKYAARLGQCFSTTRAIHSARVKIVKLEDVERNGYCFTDGVGKISDLLANLIAQDLNLPSDMSPPSAFQFRMGGCKGILAVWPDAKGQEVHIRKSQQKFTAVYNGLEIIRCSQFSTAALNRQTIVILSSLGVPDEVFNRMLLEQLSNYQAALGDRAIALDLLSRYIDSNQMTLTIAGMVVDGFMDSREPFLMSLLHLWRCWSIKALKEKARIIVEKGAFLLGVVDETGILKGHKNQISTMPGCPMKLEDLPQIFVQVPERSQTGRYVVIDGICVLGRNPSLHPGDIRVVRAIDVPALHHLRDVVVFPQQGDRDVPSMCSGGDLDGDDFFVLWDKDLEPKEWNVKAMSYSVPKPMELGKPIKIQDLMRFFVRFMKNDTLPTIALAHVAQSDYRDRGVKDPVCLRLAELHSKAVDYVKTGEKATMEKDLIPRRWPHFMEKKFKPKEAIYVSEKILGQLYDKVESVDFIPQYEAPFDHRILNAYPVDAALLKEARLLKYSYDTAMKRVMAQHEIRTEFEIWSAFVLSKPRVGTDYKMHEVMADVSIALKTRFRKNCTDVAGGKDFDKLAPFVAAMYRVTYEEMDSALGECRMTRAVGGKEVPLRSMEPRYMPLMSFPWIFHDVLGRIANRVLF